MMLKVNVGHWETSSSHHVLIVDYISLWIHPYRGYGRMQAWFCVEGPDAWHTDEYGDVYDADDQNDWLQDFAGHFLHLGFTSEAICDIDFSESGAQTPEYVDFDICNKFVQELRAMFPAWAVCDG